METKSRDQTAIKALTVAACTAAALMLAGLVARPSSGIDHSTSPPALQAQTDMPSQGGDGFIRGRVVARNPSVALETVRVVAYPDTFMLSPRFTGTAELENPAEFGWFLAQCAPDGSFALGPGIDPGRGYRVRAAGHGAAGRPEASIQRAGDEIAVEVVDLWGVEVAFVGERGEPWDWTDQFYPPAWITQAVQTNISMIELALLGVPLWMEGIGAGRLYRYRQENPAGPMAATAGARSPDGTTHRMRVNLQPLRDGLHRVTMEVPGISETFPLVTLHFPRDLVDALLGDAEITSLHSMFELHGVDSPRAFGFSPQLRAGQATWTTTSLPPGRYWTRLDLLANQAIGVSNEQHVKGRNLQGEVDVGPGPTDLYLPDMAYAVLVVDEVEERLDPEASMLLVKVQGKRSYFGKALAPPYRLPVFWDDESDVGRLWNAQWSTAFEKLDLETGQGASHFRLSQGEVLHLRPGGIVTPIGESEPAK